MIGIEALVESVNEAERIIFGNIIVVGFRVKQHLRGAWLRAVRSAWVNLGVGGPIYSDSKLKFRWRGILDFFSENCGYVIYFLFDLRVTG